MAAAHRHLVPAVIADYTASFLTCLWVLSLAVRLTVRDRFVPASTIFYATPVVVLAAAAALIAVLHLLRRRKVRALVSTVATAACLLWWYSTCWFSYTAAPANADLRVLTWNIAGANSRWQTIVDQIRQANPDIVAINEAGATTPERNQLFQASFPDFRVSDIYYGMIVLTRGDLEEISEGELGDNGRYKHSLIRINGRSLHIIQPEIKSNPLYSRAEAWRRMDELTRAIPDEPTIILGDTNTPTDSIHVAAIRRQFVNAFELGGNGPYATWPVPFTVLAIDHIWLNRHFQVQSCRLLRTWRSDHRPMLAEISFAQK